MGMSTGTSRPQASAAIPGLLNGLFTFKTKDGKADKSQVVCQLCGKELAYHRSNSSLKYHLQNKHAGPYEAQKKKAVKPQPTQQTLEDMLPGSSKTVPKHKSGMICKAIANWVAQDCRPLSVCEDEGLAEVLKIATSSDSYSPPSRRTIKRQVDEMFSHERSVVATQLESATHVAITCDYWTSLSNKSYLGMTGHYIKSPSWDLHSVTLGVDESEERHTSNHVAAQITSITNSWSITDKLVAVVTDNARNMVNAVRVGELRHLGCAAHTLQLGINKATKECAVEALLCKSRKIVGHIKHSAANFQELQQLQELHQENVEALVSDTHI